MNYRVLVAGVVAGAVAGPACAGVLYDATGLALPQASPWTWTLGGAGATITGPSASAVYSRLDSTPTLLGQEGWSQLSPVALNNTTGYDVAFDLRVVQETHSSNDRAGISVIVLGSDHHGVELSFWTNQVWNQNDSPLFTHGEGLAHDTTSAGTGIGGLQHYNLHVAGGSYTLSAEGSNLFGGVVRDYSAFTGSPNPYGIANFLWVGDDTQEASAKADFSYFSANPVPEPATLSALALGAAALLKRRRNSA